MAIPYEEVKKKYEDKMNASLTQEELNQIANVEKKIDDKILKDFNDNEISFEEHEVNFTQKNIYRRALLMFAELERRYKSAGWKIKIYNTEDDGPNRPGFTYWQLYGK